MKRSSRAGMMYILPGLLLAAGFVLSCAMGKYRIDWGEILSAGTMSYRVFWRLRLPRTIMVCVAGVCLSVAGLVYQTVFRNPLASPDVAGTASGASAGAAVGMLLGGAGALVPVCAFAGGLAAVGCVSLLARLTGRRDTASLLLSGIAVNAVCQALLMLCKLAFDTDGQLASLEFWLMGGFNDVTPDKLLSVLPFAAASLALLALLRRPIALLASGDDDAAMLGVRVRGTRAAAMGLATLMVSSVISCAGLISFAGLLAPHIAMRLTDRAAPRRYLTALVGADLLLIADILARSVAPNELPVSVFLSLAGAPALFILLCRERSARNG